MRHTQKISFDFDGCLDRTDIQLIVERMILWGDDVHIITSRQASNNNFLVFELADELGIKKENIHFTNMQSKLEKILELGINMHWDDMEDEIDAINGLCSPKLTGILVGYTIPSQM